MNADRSGNTVRYGRINLEMVGRWRQLPEAEDGPFWALNLMKYRDIADYADGRAEVRSGRDADDEYTPRESLAAIGAEIAFGAEVEQIVVGDDTAWDRVGIVRYPSRRKFFEMQQRDEFKRQHVHKDAGMEFTIVMSCLPVMPFGGSVERSPFVELRITSSKADAAAGNDIGLFEVEGVIVGDERTWARAAFRWLDATDIKASGDRSSDAGEYRMILRPSIDRLTRSVLDAAAERTSAPSQGPADRPAS